MKNLGKRCLRNVTSVYIYIYLGVRHFKRQRWKKSTDYYSLSKKDEKRKEKKNVMNGLDKNDNHNDNDNGDWHLWLCSWVSNSLSSNNRRYSRQYSIDKGHTDRLNKSTARLVMTKSLVYKRTSCRMFNYTRN